MLPILFQSNNFILYSYPLFMGLAWGIGYQYFFYHLKNEDRLRGQILFWGVFLMAWIGAKVLFIITSSDDLSSDFLNSASFWMGGGFVFYGGMIGGALFAVIYHLMVGIKKEWLKWATISLVLGHGIGRIGCFLAGCCYGEVTDWWWGVHLHGHDRHPTQLLEALSLIALARILMKIKDSELVLAGYAFSYGILRFVLEFLRGDQLRGQWAWGLTPSQWISLIFVILATCLILRSLKTISK